MGQRFDYDYDYDYEHEGGQDARARLLDGELDLVLIDNSHPDCLTGAVCIVTISTNPRGSSMAKSASSANVGNMVIGQSGGPTVVINQSLVGAILEAQKHKKIIQNIYGARHGVKGILGEDFIDLTEEPQGQPAASGRRHARPRALGSVRKKPTAEECQRDVQDPAGAQRPLLLLHRRQRLGRDRRTSSTRWPQDAELRAARLPHPQDHRQRPARAPTTAPASARRPSSSPRPSWATTSTTARCPGIKIDVIMGRHAGFLTAAAALGRATPGRRPAPDLPARSGRSTRRSSSRT